MANLEQEILLLIDLKNQFLKSLLVVRVFVLYFSKHLAIPTITI